MEHLQIAYDLLVIMIGLAALSIVVFWAVRTGEADLRDFSIPYTCISLSRSVDHFCAPSLDGPPAVTEHVAKRKYHTFVNVWYFCCIMILWLAIHTTSIKRSFQTTTVFSALPPP
jgi:hypothetical protein